LIEIWPAATAAEIIIVESSIGQGRRLTADDSPSVIEPCMDAVPQAAEPVVPTTLPLTFGTSDPPTSWFTQWQPDGRPEQVQARWNLTDDGSDDWVELDMFPDHAGDGAR
jgi:hypothetical protein